MTDQTEPLTKERFMQIHGIPQPGALTAERLAEIRAAAIHAVEQHPSTTFMAPCESLADAVLDAVQPALLAEIERLTARVAELEARPDRATVLRAAAADWDRETPDETVTCRDVAAALRLMAAIDSHDDVEPVDPWQQATTGLNALVAARALWHLTPDCAIANLDGPERIEYDRDGEVWRLVRDEGDGGEPDVG